MTQNNHNTRVRQPRKDYTLRGEDNIETLINTGNAVLGMTTTTVFTSANVFTSLVEGVLTMAMPQSVADAIHTNAVGDGFMATIDSLFSEESTAAAVAKMSEWKRSILGSNDDATSILTNNLDPKHRIVAKLIFLTLPKADRNNFNTKLNAMSDDEYEILIDDLDNKISTVDKKDMEKIKDIANTL